LNLHDFYHSQSLSSLFDHKQIDYDGTLKIMIKSQKCNFNRLVSIADLNQIDNPSLGIYLKLFFMQ